MPGKSGLIRLTDTQKWEVAKYCIEHKGVVEDPTKEKKYKFRIFQKELAEEISNKLFKINTNHLGVCMDFYITVCNLTENFPELPKEVKVETVQDDTLKIRIEKLEGELSLLQKKNSQLETEKQSLLVKLYNFKEKIETLAKWSKL